MSHQATTWVLERSEVEGLDFIVLFVIANHCHPDGTGAWPSMHTIGAESRSSERSARRAVARLIASKEITVVRNKYLMGVEDGDGRNNYTIPGVVQDGFFRKRIPRKETEAIQAAGLEIDNGQPNGQNSGHDWPHNNPLNLEPKQDLELDSNSTPTPVLEQDQSGISPELIQMRERERLEADRRAAKRGPKERKPFPKRRPFETERPPAYQQRTYPPRPAPAPTEPVTIDEDYPKL